MIFLLSNELISSSLPRNSKGQIGLLAVDPLEFLNKILAFNRGENIEENVAKL